MIQKSAKLGVAKQADKASESQPEALRDHATLQGTVGGGMASRAVAVAGSMAYLGTGLGLTVLDLTQPASPSAVAELALPGMPVDLVVQGNRGYAALLENGLAVLDLTDPFRPNVASHLELGGVAVAIVVTGTVAWVAAEEAGLLMVDVTDVARPRQIRSLAELGPVHAVAVSGRKVLVAGDWGTWIFDAEDPSHPLNLDKAWRGGAAADVGWVGETRAVVALEEEGLVVLDVASPASPRLLAKLELKSLGLPIVNRLSVDGSVVWLMCGGFATEANGLVSRVDLSDPASPLTAGSLSLVGTVADLAANGTRVLLADPFFGLRQVEWTAGGEYVELGTAGLSGSGDSVAAHGTWAMVGTEDGRLAVFDVSDLAHPQQVAEFGTEANVHDVAWEGSLGYLAAGEGGLRILDLSDPAHPLQVGTVDLPGSAEGVVVAGRWAYVGCGEEGLAVVDVTDPTHPRLTGRVDTPGWAWSVAVAGPVAWVADREGGLITVDLADPSQPRVLDRLVDSDTSPRGWVRDVVVADDVAWVAKGPNALDGGEGQLLAADATRPAQLSWLTKIGIPIRAIGLAARGDRVYVAGGGGSGLMVFDVANPAVPKYLGAIADVGASAVALEGHYAVVADAPFLDRGRLRLVVLPDDGLPYQAGTYFRLQDHWQAQGVAVDGRLAVVSTYEFGWRAVDVTQPNRPRQVAADMRPDSPNVALRDGLAYVIQSDVLEIVDLRDPANSRRLGRLVLNESAQLLLAGPLAYLYGFPFGGGVSTVDISDPSQPRLLARHTGGVAYSPLALTLLAGRLYGTHWAKDLLAWRLGDPRQLEPMGLRTPLRAVPGPENGRVLAGGGVLWVANDDGLAALDPSDPCAVRMVAQVPEPLEARLLALEAGVLWAQGRMSELVGWDVSNPAEPRRVVRIRPPGGWGRAVAMSGNQVYVAAGDAGLLVYRLERADAPAVVDRLFLPIVLAGATPPTRPLAVTRGLAPSPDGAATVMVVEWPATGRVTLTRRAIGQTAATEIPVPGLIAAEAPSFDPAGQTVLFAGRLALPDGKPADWDVYRVELDGTNLTNLTQAPASDERWPTMASHGRYVVFSSNRDGNAELYRLDLPRRDWLRLTNHPAADTQPSFAPNDDLAFVSNRDGNAEVYRLQPGGQLERVTQDPDPDEQPAFSTDGRLLAWQARTTCSSVAGQSRSGSMVLRVRDLATGSTRTVSQPGADLAWPHLLPGNRSLLAGSNNGGWWDADVVPAEGPVAGQ